MNGRRANGICRENSHTKAIANKIPNNDQTISQWSVDPLAENPQ